MPGLSRPLPLTPWSSGPDLYPLPCSKTVHVFPAHQYIIMAQDTQGKNCALTASAHYLTKPRAGRPDMPEDHLAALIGSVQPIEESRAGPTNMQIACGGRCKAHSDL